MNYKEFAKYYSYPRLRKYYKATGNNKTKMVIFIMEILE
jgi:hypothetical protein